MARSRSTYSKVTSNKQNGERVVSYSRSNTTYNGSFVYSIFILVCCFFVLIGAFAIEKNKDDPVGLVIGVSDEISSYGDNFINNLHVFHDGIYSLKADPNSDRVIEFGGLEIPVNGILKAYNGLINVVYFLLVIPYSTISFSVNFLVCVVNIIGICLFE